MFTQDFKPEPYWWDIAPPVPGPEADLPRSVDILIVGSGYTGLHAALQTARAGRTTLVLDAEVAGFGASTRNGGQISTSVKHGFKTLEKRFGAGRARAILAEGQASLDFITRFVQEEKIDCAFRTVGRFHGAHTARQYDILAKEAEAKSPIPTDAFMVPKHDQHSELGTDAYFGGIVYPHHASLHPGLYHKGLRARAETAGARIICHCAVTGLTRLKDGFTVHTAKGEVRAKKVILATNGYTGPLSPWHQRRVIPIGSYIIATQELPKEVMDRLIPTDRILSDTRKLVYYYRPSPDRKRILFGGRVSLRETDPLKTGPKLRAELIRLFPDLAGVEISHSWSGFVGYTFDTLMHSGQKDGLYYAMGYCGSGVGMASYLGMKIGQQAADNPKGALAFDQIPFPTRPLYSGNPWFLAPSVLAYRVRDRLGL